MPRPHIDPTERHTARVFPEGQEPRLTTMPLTDDFRGGYSGDQEDVALTSHRMIAEDSALIMGNLLGGALGGGDPFDSLPDTSKVEFQERYQALAKAMRELREDLFLARWG